MKVKSIMLMVIILVTGIMFAAYSTKAQKSESEKAKDDKAYQKILEQKKQVEIERNRIIPQEELMAEIGKSAVCTTLYQNMLSKEADQWSVDTASCSGKYFIAVLGVKRDKERVSIGVIRERTPELAKSFLKGPQPSMGTSLPSDEFGDGGLKFYEGLPVDKSIKPNPVTVLFIKGRFIVEIQCEQYCKSETLNHFAEYTLTALEGQ
jgi:hypothetical protein